MELLVPYVSSGYVFPSRGVSTMFPHTVYGMEVEGQRPRTNSVALEEVSLHHTSSTTTNSTTAASGS